MISTMIFCSIACMAVCAAAITMIVVVLTTRIANLERRFESEIETLKEENIDFTAYSGCDPPPDPKHRPNLFGDNQFGHD